MGDRVAVFKAIGLGDYIREPETITLDGEEPEKASGLYGDRGVFGDRGGGSIYRVELKAHVHRTGSETYVNYLKRRLTFLTQLRAARGFYPNVAPFNASTAGILAVLEDSSMFRVSTALASIGSNVSIPTSGGAITIANDELWYGFHTSSGVYTAFFTGASSGSSIVADVLDVAMPSGSYFFRATFLLRGAYLLPGITLQGEEPGSTSATRDIPLAFVSVDDPLYDQAPSP